MEPPYLLLHPSMLLVPCVPIYIYYVLHVQKTYMQYFISQSNINHRINTKHVSLPTSHPSHTQLTEHSTRHVAFLTQQLVLTPTNYLVLRHRADPHKLGVNYNVANTTYKFTSYQCKYFPFIVYMLTDEATQLSSSSEKIARW